MPNKWKTFFISILLLSISTLQSQELANLFINYHESHHTEKIFVHTDNSYYFPEHTIYGKVYLVHGTDHRLIDTSVLVHVKLIDSAGVIKNDLVIKTSEGQAPFSIETSLDYKPGRYTLTAFTQYQRNFDEAFIFQKEILITTSYENLYERDSSLIKKPKMLFFPEGGHLVYNHTSKVAFKIKDAVSTQDETVGEIIDQNDKVIASFSVDLEDMGSFLIKPEPGHQYFAMLNDERYELPVPLQNSGTLKAISKDSTIVLTCMISPSNPGSYYILGHIRGELFLKKNLEQSTKLRLNKNDIPSGIVHFTLFNQDDLPVAERLFFNYNTSEKVDINISLNEINLSKRKKITGVASIDALASQKQSAQASLSIYASEVLDYKINSTDIDSYLLLQSDIKGRIPNYSYWYHSDRRDEYLDLLMLTHGWRKFSWQDILTEQHPLIAYPVEMSSTISGKVTNRYNNKPIEADISMTILDDSIFSMAQLTTDKDGLFQFSGLELQDSTDIVLQASRHKKRKKKKDVLKIEGNRFVDITLIDWKKTAFNLDMSIPLSVLNKIDNEILPLDEEIELKQRIKENQESVFQDALWLLDVDELVISSRVNPAQKRSIDARKIYKEKGLFSFSSTPKYDPNEEQFRHFNFRDIFQMVKTIVPGINYDQKGGIPRLILGLDLEITLVIDGRITSNERALYLDPESVAMIDYITGPRAGALYGSEFVIVLLTKNQEQINKTQAKGVINIAHPGYHKARTFYTPDYSVDYLESLDNRVTLFWDPDITLYDLPHTFEFTTSDVSGQFIIELQGITEGGIPFVKREQIRVE